MTLFRNKAVWGALGCHALRRAVKSRNQGFVMPQRQPQQAHWKSAWPQRATRIPMEGDHLSVLLVPNLSQIRCLFQFRKELTIRFNGVYICENFIQFISYFINGMHLNCFYYAVAVSGYSAMQRNNSFSKAKVLVKIKGRNIILHLPVCAETVWKSLSNHAA